MQMQGARTSGRAPLKAVHLQVLLLADGLFHQDGSHLDAVVALQLNDVAELLVLDDIAIAGKFLLEHLEDALEVERLWQALDGGDCLATGSLLYSYICTEGGGEGLPC